MKRRNFLRNSALVAATGLAASTNAFASSPTGEKEIYEWRVYQFRNGAQKRKLDEFYSRILIPTLRGFGVKVGAFESYGQADPPRAYYLLVFSSLPEYHRIKKHLWSDISFLDRSKDFYKETAKEPAYDGFDTYLMEAFSSIPKLRTPDPKRGIFELRTYESNNEEAAQRKIKMFNNEELTLFDEIGLHATFFGEILSGPKMPALMYMLWFNDMDERNEKWATFRENSDWKKMRTKKEYENTVSVVNKEFLLPMPHSQF